MNLNTPGTVHKSDLYFGEINRHPHKTDSTEEPHYEASSQQLTWRSFVFTVNLKMAELSCLPAGGTVAPCFITNLMDSEIWNKTHKHLICKDTHPESNTHTQIHTRRRAAAELWFTVPSNLGCYRNPHGAHESASLINLQKESCHLIGRLETSHFNQVEVIRSEM